MLDFQNDELKRLHVQGPYRDDQLAAIARALDEHRTLQLSPLDSGLYPASSVTNAGASGYGDVWVRDNVFVALALWESGRPDAAAAVGKALLAFYHKYRHRLVAAIDAAGPPDVSNRPHVRFNGQTLDEIPGKRWAHAQNDALGYCLWLCARLIQRGILPAQPEFVDTMASLARYFAAIRYWEDEDSGHWEETRKVSASSVGVVVAGLRAWTALLADAPVAAAAHMSGAELLASAHDSIEKGLSALSSILPGECAQLSPRQNRRYDAALLFLLYPLEEIGDAIGDLVLHDAHRYLQGPIGIRRYLGDSYWAPDYDTRVSAMDRTRDYSDDMQSRDRLLEHIGDEAQWCIFDPLLSAYYGRRYGAAGIPAHRDAQAWHFNRALAQVTSDWRCPELYYKRKGEFVANPHSPLLWTQANLLLALTAMRATARRASAERA